MKVLQVHNSYQQAGGEDVVVDQERHLLERMGHRVVEYRRSNWEAAAYSGLRRLELVQNTLWSTDTRREFVSLLRKEKPDLVHVHNTFIMISPSIYSVCQQAAIPVVQTLHNYRLFCPAAIFFRDGHVCEDCVEHGLLQAIKHSCYRGSRAATATVALMLAVHRQRHTWTQDVNCYIALCEFARNKVIESGISPSKVVVKPNFVFPDPCLRTDSGGDYALFVGRLSPEKRVSTLLTAWSRLRHRIPLRVIGGGPELADLQMDALKNELDTVTFLGYLPREQTIQAIKGARFLVFSSEWYETFCLTIAESFACGVPVLCSRLGAMQEIVQDGQTGLHFTPGDPDDLARKIEWAWAHPESMRLMGKQARQEYEIKYTAERNYPLLMDIYRRVIAEAQGVRPLHASQA